MARKRKDTKAATVDRDEATIGTGRWAHLHREHLGYDGFGEMKNLRPRYRASIELAAKRRGRKNP